MNIMGADFSRGFAEKAKKDAPNIPLYLADVEHLLFNSGTFDASAYGRLTQFQGQVQHPRFLSCPQQQTCQAQES